VIPLAARVLSADPWKYTEAKPFDAS